jgi:hypothetical protein
MAGQMMETTMDDRIISQLSPPDPRRMSDREWDAIKRQALQLAYAERNALMRAMVRHVFSWIARAAGHVASVVKASPRDVAAARQRM